MRSKVMVAIACGAVLALGACSGSSSGHDQTRINTLTAERDAARAALTAARDALARTQAAQRAVVVATTDDQREKAEEALRTTLSAAENTVKAAEMRVAEAPATAATPAVQKALASTRAALASVRALYPASARTDDHTPLGRALTAVARAQADLAAAQEALAEAPDDAVQTVLAEAQAALTTAQLSLLPRLQQELAWLRGVNDKQDALTGAQAATAQAQAAVETARRAVDAARENYEEAIRTLAAAADADEAEAQVTVRQRATALQAEQAALVAAEAALRIAQEAERTAAAAFVTAARTALSGAQTDAQRTAAQAKVDAAMAAAPPAPGAWAAGTPLAWTDGAVVEAGTARVTRTPRTDTGEDGWAKLAIRTGPVAYAAGRTVLSAGGAGTTDELPMRSAVLRAAGPYPIKLQGDDGSAPDHYRNTDGVVTSSLRLSEDDLTVRFGGEGVVYYDMQRQFNYFSDADGTPNHDSWWRYGPDGKLGDDAAAAGGTITASHARDLGLAAAGGTLTSGQATALQGYVTDNAGARWQVNLSVCGDWAHDDLTISLGRPSSSPDGEPAHYWKVRIPFTVEQAVAPPVKSLLLDTRPADIGQYEVWLSNHAGVDDKGTESEADDAVRYLDHAAYGLFMLHDNLVNEPRYIRPQAFAVSYDAFQDLENLRTTDVATSMAARFEARTMARTLISRPFNSRADRIAITDTKPMRGDITLNACIGGAGCTGEGFPTDANRIAGMISNFEHLRVDGTWLLYEPTNGGIPLQEAAIAVDGNFKGQVGHPRHIPESGSIRGRDPSDFVSNTGSFAANPTPRPASGPATGDDNGYAAQWSGNLYGPRDALEAAGWWHLPYDGRAREGGWVSIIGSFGAVCTNCE